MYLNVVYTYLICSGIIYYDYITSDYYFVQIINKSIVSIRYNVFDIYNFFPIQHFTVGRTNLRYFIALDKLFV